MDASLENISRALQKAMQAENEGYYFYQMAAQNTEDPKGRRVFQYLAEEEKKHFSFLQHQYGIFTKTGKADGTVKLERKKADQDPSPIFSPEIKDRVGEAHYEMTALSIGIQLETNAVAFYQTAARESGKDLVMQAFFEDLVDWEKEHLNLLRKQSDLLREDYWNQGGFAPF